MAKNDNWSTPPELIKVLDAEFHFTLEVCAAADNRALPNIPYMGLDNGRDALVEPFWGNPGEVCYCNPPYSMKIAFVQKAFTQVDRTIVMLLPVDSDTSAWQDVIGQTAHEIRLLRGRLSFLLYGKKQSTARFPSAVVIWRPYKGSMYGANVSFWDWRSE